MSSRAMKFAVEDAIAAYLEGVNPPDCRVYRTLTVAIDGIAVEPCIMVCSVASRPENGEAAIAHDANANRICDLRIQVRTHAEPTEAQSARERHVELCGMLLEKMQQSDLISQLNTAAAGMGIVFGDWWQDDGDTTAPSESSIVTTYSYVFCVRPTTE